MLSENRHPVLIGMPGCGKSTLGAALARRLGRALIDTDRCIEERAGMSLQAYLDRHGPAAFQQMERDAVLAVEPRGPAVIATGGSVVYSEDAMAHLSRLGPVVHLDVPLHVLQARVGAGTDRGLLRPGGGDLPGLLAERQPLYRRYADLHIPLGDDDVETQAQQIEALLAAYDSDTVRR